MLRSSSSSSPAASTSSALLAAAGAAVAAASALWALQVLSERRRGAGSVLAPADPQPQPQPQPDAEQQPEQQRREDGQPPAGVSWISAAEFRVLRAILETFMPAFALEEGEGGGGEGWREKARRALMQAVFLPRAAGGDAFVRGVEEWTRRMTQLQALSGTGNAELFRSGAGSVDAASAAAIAVQENLPADKRMQLRVILFLLRFSLSSFFLTGYATPFASLKFPQREKVLQFWRGHGLQALRTVSLTFKKLASGMFVGLPTGPERLNPVWKDVSYATRDENIVRAECDQHGRSWEHRLQMGTVRDGEQIECDVVVVGSGCGGCVVASELAVAGYTVVLLEKGPYVTEEDFAKWRELDALRAMFEQQGLCSDEQLNVAILAGSCVGGGSTLNWSASFRTPSHVRREWRERFGLEQMGPGGAMDRALDSVCERLNVNIDFSHRNEECPAANDTFVTNQNNENLWTGARAAGSQCRPIPRNVRDCINCGACCHGCPYRSKQSGVLAYLEPAFKTGRLTILDRTWVDHVIVQDGVARGVVARRVDEGPTGAHNHTGHTSVVPEKTLGMAEEGGCIFTVSARKVVSSAGALHSPALLLRSGLTNPNVGAYLALHPVMAVAGMFGDQLIRGYEGVTMGTYVDEHMSMDNTGYGVIIETPPMHQALMAMGMSWENAAAWRVTAAAHRNSSCFICILRDRTRKENRVTIDESGRPRYHYSVTEQDKRFLLRGFRETMKLMRAAGADAQCPVWEGAPWFVNAQPGLDGVEAERAFQEYLSDFEKAGVVGSQTHIFSAHQMGSCRMAATAEMGAVKPTGETWDVENLYVADGSILPTAPGVNPMVSIYAVSYMVAENIAHSLGGSLKRDLPSTKFPAGPTNQGSYGGIATHSVEW